MRRGEIWWATLRKPEGSEPGYRRPVLIVQSDVFNESKLKTVVAVAITSNTRLGEAPGNVTLARKQSKLSKESVANVSQIVTLDRSRLIERVSQLPGDVMHQIEKGLRLVLGLSGDHCS